MNNPIHVVRLFRADRLRKQQRSPVEIKIKPRTEQARNDSKFDRDEVVFWVCAVLAVAAFWLSVLGVI